MEIKNYEQAIWESLCNPFNPEEVSLYRYFEEHCSEELLELVAKDDILLTSVLDGVLKELHSTTKYWEITYPLSKALGTVGKYQRPLILNQRYRDGREKAYVQRHIEEYGCEPDF